MNRITTLPMVKHSKGCQTHCQVWSKGVQHRIDTPRASHACGSWSGRSTNWHPTTRIRSDWLMQVWSRVLFASYKATRRIKRWTWPRVDSGFSVLNAEKIFWTSQVARNVSPFIYGLFSCCLLFDHSNNLGLMDCQVFRIQESVMTQLESVVNQWLIPSNVQLHFIVSHSIVSLRLPFPFPRHEQQFWEVCFFLPDTS